MSTKDEPPVRQSFAERLRAGPALEVLRPNGLKAALFLSAALAHLALNLGFGFVPGLAYRFNLPYSGYDGFVSLLYGSFNFPLAIFKATNIWSFKASNPAPSLLVPLALHLAYWYAVASALGHVIRLKDEALRYRYYTAALAVAIAFILMMHLFRSFGLQPV
jgi:hypothetical protein